MYEVDDLVRSYRMSLDSDPEYSGPAKDLFKSQKAKIEKQLKALEIIKKKGVDVGVLITIFEEHRPKEDYNCGVYEEYQFTQEEFDLLEEVLLK